MVTNSEEKKRLGVGMEAADSDTNQHQEWGAGRPPMRVTRIRINSCISMILTNNCKEESYVAIS